MIDRKTMAELGVSSGEFVALEEVSPESSGEFGPVSSGFEDAVGDAENEA